MLPRLKILFLFLGCVLFLGVLYTAFTKLSFATVDCDPGENWPSTDFRIVNPLHCEDVVGTKQIKVVSYDLMVDHIDIWLDAEGSGQGWKCYVLATGLKPSKATSTYKEFTKDWNSATVVDWDPYYLVAEGHNQDDAPWRGTVIKISTKNGKTGTICQAPDVPQNGQKPPTKKTGNGTQPSDGTNQQTTSQTETSPTTTDSTDEKKKKDDAGKVEEVIIEEEIPITISAFDPDIFLKGGNVSIKEITNLEKDGATALYFSGKAKPNTLVTLYIFSNPVIVAVESDAAGNWSYNREKNLDSGKHTVFATIYDDGVTRRSNVTEFYIAKSSGTGRSLILEKTTFQRFYPYALVLGTAIIVAVLVVFMYRIYRKRAQANI